MPRSNGSGGGMPFSRSRDTSGGVLRPHQGGLGSRRMLLGARSLTRGAVFAIVLGETAEGVPRCAQDRFVARRVRPRSRASATTLGNSERVSWCCIGHAGERRAVCRSCGKENG